MEHGRGRHLGAKSEPPDGFGAVDLDGFPIAARDGLDHLVDAGQDGTNRLVLGRTKTPWARRWISPTATRRESVRSTAPRVPCFRKRALVKGLPLGSFRMAARTAFAVDMAWRSVVRKYMDHSDE